MTESFTFRHDGAMYRAQIEIDSNHGAPWEEYDGCGIVSDWTTRAKLPGEIVLVESRGARRFYDFAATMRKAKHDGWNHAPYDVGSRKQKALRAVLADYDRLRGWCYDDWCFVGIVVTRIDTCDCCGETKETHIDSRWGIESDSGDEYFHDVAREMVKP